MKTSTAKPYSSFLLTTPATTGSSETTSRSDSAKNSKKTDDVDGEEDEVYILYGVLFNNGSEPMIASNITDSQVVEQEGLGGKLVKSVRGQVVGVENEVAEGDTD